MNKKQYITPAAVALQLEAQGPLAASNGFENSSIIVNPETMDEGDGDDAAVKDNAYSFDF